ncbi:MAG: Trk system potassium transporter TrkA [Chlamydiota bacterium]
MNVLILGAGDLGSYLAQVLSREEHCVVLADHDPARLDYLSKSMDVATVLCRASNWRMLQSLLRSSCDYFIAMTGSDETNLAVCTLAKNLGYKTTICRIEETGYLNRTVLDFARLFSVDHFVGTEILSAQQLLQKVFSLGEHQQEQFSYGAIHMKTIKIPSSFAHAGVPIRELPLPQELIIGLIWRQEGKEPGILFPHGSDVLLAEDRVILVGEAKAMLGLERFFSLPYKLLQRAVIVGGTDVSAHLAMALEELGVHVKIIEKEGKRCKELAKALPDATILHHEGSDFPFLIAENVERSDIFIAATHQDAENLLIASVGKKAGAPHVLSLISDLSVSTIFKEARIEYAVSGKVDMTHQILAIIHGKNFLSISSVFDDQARVIELKVSENAQLIGIPLRDLAASLPEDLLICVIANKGQVMVGRGNRMLSPGDTVIVMTSPRTIHELEHLF